MKKRKTLHLRDRLFLLILGSMLALMLCMGGLFLLLMQNVRAQEEQQLTDFSQDMIKAYREDRMYSELNETNSSCRLLSFLAEHYITDTSSWDFFEAMCWNTVNAYSQTKGADADNDILFIISTDSGCFFTPNGITRAELEFRINEIYEDERRQCEANFDAADGYEWLENFDFADSYIETEDGLISIAFTMPMYYAERNVEPIKVGVIRETHDAETLDSTSQMLVNQIAENTRLLDESAFRRAVLILALALFLIILLCLLYTRRIAGYVADPIELERLRAKQEKEALEAADRMKTTFLSDVSHELKTPLAAMSGYAQTAEIELTGGGNANAIQEMLRRISSEANRMAMMVSQILDATRIEEGRMILELAPCDLDKLVRDTVGQYFAVLNKNDNRLVLRIPLDLPPVQADSAKLCRVFVNLISNALKHTHSGVILIKAEETYDTVQVTVKDNGSGIFPEDMPHIWERYYKGKRSETGTGLGLFICRSIIEAHGGTIRAESEPGKGTAFVFTLSKAEQKPQDTILS